MYIKWIGAVLVLLSCGGVGFYLSAGHKREQRMLAQLISALDYMECELQYRLTPLPDLCRQAGNQTGQALGCLLISLAEELESQISPDVASCMHTVLSQSKPIPNRTLENLRLLGKSLGRFDLEGQIQGLESLRYHCREDLKNLRKDQDVYIRNCQTLGLCAGAALVILFI